MNGLLPMFFAGPLLAAAMSLLDRSGRLGRALGILAPAVVAVAGVGLVVATRDGSVVVAQVAGWPGGVAIPFVADLFSALMLTVTGLLALAGMVFALASGHATDWLFAPLVLVMTAGVLGAYLTADLFNLFVMIEVALLPSYVLLARTRTPAALRAARLYLTVNLTASTLLLAGLGGVYGTAGTVNLAALAGLGSTPAVALAIAIILVALGVKAALVPTHTWLPATYPAATPAVTALFSAMLTKVGIYALIRIVTIVHDPTSALALVVVVVAGLSMVIGMLGALGETTTRGILAFHMVSQVGYVLIGVALAGAVGLAAAVFYLVQYTVVKTSLFLTVGAVEVRRGSGTLKDFGGVAGQHRWAALGFLLGALSLTGLPPFSGFWAKLGLLSAATAAGSAAAFALILLVSVGTLVSMLKLGTGVFWGVRPEGRPAPAPAAGPPTTWAAGPSTGSDASHGPAPAPIGGAPSVAMLNPDSDARAEAPTRDPGGRWPMALVAPGVLLAGLSLLVGLHPEPLLVLAEAAGVALADPTAYVEGVLGR